MNVWEEAITLDTYLVSDFPEVRKLGDLLFQEIMELNKDDIKTPRERYKVKETLKIILINLSIGHQAGLTIRYSRRKCAYSKNNRYRKIYFKYNRVILVIDSLEHIGYIEHKNGFNDREKGIKRQARMKATAKLTLLFNKFDFFTVDLKKELLSFDDLVQLRNQDETLIDDDFKGFEPMRERIDRYNRFILKQKIEARLNSDVEVSRHFLELLKIQAIKGLAEISVFNSSQDMKITLAGIEQSFQGFEINNKNYIILEERKETIKSYLKQVKIQISNKRSYYNKYINTMTGTYFDNFEDNQALNVFEATTMKQEWSDSKKRPLSDYGIQRLHFISKYQYLHRVFNVLPDLGGRFYGALHISLPKKVRRNIFINGLSTVELDFGAHHIRMIYNYYLDMPYEDDPYRLLCQDNPDERGIYKRVLLVAINAKDEKSAIKGIRDKLRKDHINYDLTDKPIKACLDKAKKHHHKISRFIHSGIGLQLQYYEGRIGDIVLSVMTKEGIPCIPVHDSFIVPFGHEEELRNVMVGAYQKIIGNFMPVIEKKE